MQFYVGPRSGSPYEVHVVKKHLHYQPEMLSSDSIATKYLPPDGASDAEIAGPIRFSKPDHMHQTLP